MATSVSMAQQSHSTGKLVQCNAGVRLQCQAYTEEQPCEFGDVLQKNERGMIDRR